jgi:hypothetical protein
MKENDIAKEVEKEHVYQQTYKDYLNQIARLDFNFIANTLGVKLDGDDVIIPFFGKPYRVSSKSITDPSGKQPHLSICVILCKYLLMCPLIEPLGGNWMAFKDFKDAAPLVHAFSNTVNWKNQGKRWMDTLPTKNFPMIFVCNLMPCRRYLCCCFSTIRMTSFPPNAACCLKNAPKNL